MHTDLKFIIHSEMTMENNENLQAHGRASLLATWVTVTTPLTYNRLATIIFEDPAILQQKENGRYANYYHVIIAEQSEKDLMLSLWVAKDCIGFVVALQYHSTPELELSKEYKAFTCERKLTEAEISGIFQGIFANPSVIHPIDIATIINDKDNTQKLRS